MFMHQLDRWRFKHLYSIIIFLTAKLYSPLFKHFLSDPTENLLKETKSSSWTPINTGVQKGESCDALNYVNKNKC